MRLLIAVDLFDHPDGVVSAAGAWAAQLGAVGDLVYVAPDRLSHPWLASPELTYDVAAAWDAVHAQEREELRSLTLKLPDAVRGQALHRLGEPGHVVPEIAAELGHDAIVVVSHGRRGLARAWMGSVAERVVRYAHVPVLVLHQEH